MAHTGKDEKHHEHPCTANNQRLAAAVVLDNVETVERCSEVDAIQNHLSDEGIIDAGTLEDNGSVVLKSISGAFSLELKRERACIRRSSWHLSVAETSEGAYQEQDGIPS